MSDLLNLNAPIVKGLETLEGRIVLQKLLQTRGIEKTFDGYRVLTNMNLSLEKGVVHVIGGLNGAGKSTLVKILSGQLSQDKGEILIRGERVELAGLKSARQHRIAVVHQEYMLVPDLTVADNIALGSGEFTANRRKLNANAARAIEKVELALDPSTKVSELSRETQSLVEVAAAVSTNPEILLIDDLFSSLDKTSLDKLARLIEKLKEEGTAILLTTVEPRMMLARDRLSLLYKGELLACESAALDHLPTEFLQTPEQLIGPASREPFIELKNIAGFETDVTLFKGEVLCINCTDRKTAKLVAHAFSRCDFSGSGTVAVLQQAKNFFERFTSGALGKRSAYFDSNFKSNGFALAQVMKKKSFLFHKIVKRGAVLNREVPVTLKEFLSSLDYTDAFSRAIGAEEKALAKLRYDASDLFVFFEPTTGLDPSAIKALGTLLKDISSRGKAAVIIGRNERDRRICTRFQRIEK